MGDLFYFPLGGRRSKRSAGLAENVSAEILLFTGVRYERYADVPSSMPVMAVGEGANLPQRPGPGTPPRKRRAR